MRHSLLFALILIPGIILFALRNCPAQEVLHQLGGIESDNWDALISNPDQANSLFALGYVRETQIDDQPYLAPDRGVVLGSLNDTQINVWGNLYSRGNTRVHDICSAMGKVYIFGNAFSFLVYQSDTLISTNGRNNAFILQLDSAGQQEEFLHLNSRGAVLGQAAAWNRETQRLVTLFQIRDTLQWENQTWAPGATTASLLMQWSPQLIFQGATLIDGTGEIEGAHLKSVNDEIYIAGRFKGQINSQTDTIFTPTADFDGFIFSATAGGSERFIRHLRGQFQDDVFALEVSAEAVLFSGQFIGNLRLQNLEILTGLQVAGYLGAMDRTGQALWLHPVRGSSISLAVTAIYPDEDAINWAIRTGEITTFQDDTLRQPTSVFQVHGVWLRTTPQGQRMSWQLWPGDPIIYLTDFIKSENQLRLGSEISGRFGNVQSRGGFDAFLIAPTSSTNIFRAPIQSRALTLYPKPARSQLCVGVEPELGMTYQLISLSGQLVRESAFMTSCINISQLPPGLYVFRLLPSDRQQPIQQVWIKQ